MPVILNRTKFKRSLTDELRRYKNKFEKDLRQAYTRWFGSRYFNQWRSGRLRFGTRAAFNTSLDDLTQSSQRSAFRAVFSKAWKNRYQDIIKLHKKAVPDYKQTKWYRWKVRGLNKYKAPHYPQRKVKYKTWSLTTGFLRDAVQRDIDSGNNEIFEISNPMLVAGVRLNFDAFPDGVGDNYREFAEYLVKKGAISEINEFVQLRDDDWDEVRKLVLFYLRRGFIQDLEDTLQGRLF